MNDKKLRYLLRWIKNLEKVEINKDEKFYYIANLRVLYKIKKEHMYLNPEAFNTKNGDIIIENMCSEYQGNGSFLWDFNDVEKAYEILKVAEREEW